MISSLNWFISIWLPLTPNRLVAWRRTRFRFSMRKSPNVRPQEHRNKSYPVDPYFLPPHAPYNCLCGAFLYPLSDLRRLRYSTSAVGWRLLHQQSSRPPWLNLQAQQKGAERRSKRCFVQLGGCSGATTKAGARTPT